MIEVQEHKWCGNNDSPPNCEREESLKKQTKNSSDKVFSLRNVEGRQPVEEEDTIIDVHGVRHSRRRLRRAIDQFDKKVVELKQEFFEQAINQIEEVVRFSSSDYPLI